MLDPVLWALFIIFLLGLNLYLYRCPACGFGEWSASPIQMRFMMQRASVRSAAFALSNRYLPQRRELCQQPFPLKPDGSPIATDALRPLWLAVLSIRNGS